MNSVITSPDLINCGASSGWTIAHWAAVFGDVDIAKYAVSKGVDLTIITPGDFEEWSEEWIVSGYDGWTAYDVAVVVCSIGDNCWNGKLPQYAKRKAIFLEVATILKPPAAPAPATRPCVEVDGQTPPANEYCIIAENVQSSRRIPVRGDFEKRFAGGSDYLYKADRAMSGAGLFPGWRSVITFVCSPKAESGCGYADYHFEDRWDPSYRKTFDRIYGLNVFCGESGDLLDLDRDLGPGDSVSVVHSSDTERSSPWYMHCRANALDPFTLSITTTRLAK